MTDRPSFEAPIDPAAGVRPPTNEEAQRAAEVETKLKAMAHAMAKGEKDTCFGMPEDGDAKRWLSEDLPRRQVWWLRARHAYRAAFATQPAASHEGNCPEIPVSSIVATSQEGERRALSEIEKFGHGDGNGRGYTCADMAAAALATPSPPDTDGMRSKRITSSEWEAATAAATRGIRGGWQRGSDFAHVVAAALGMSGRSSLASENTAPSALSDDLREAYRVGFNDGADGDFNPDGFMARYHAAVAQAQPQAS